MPAIALDKTLVATATLGRISSRYPNGRLYQETWTGPQFCYPRPVLERQSDASSNALGLHTEWDKWPADTVFHARFGVKDGAYPFKVEVVDQTIDSVPTDIGFTYAKYVEDAGATTPYLGLHHTGFTAPSGGTSTLAFTIRVTDCAGATAEYAASMTIYARNHASFTDEFWVFSPSIPNGGTNGTNGTGTFASPKNRLVGGTTDGNPTVLGTDWNVTTGHLKKRMLLVTGTGEMFLEADMSNPFTAGFTRCFFTGQGNRPRQIIGLYGNTVKVKRYSGSGTGAGRFEARTHYDVTIQGLTFNRDAAAAIGGSQVHVQGINRSAVYDTTCEEQQLNGGESGNSISSFVQLIGGTQRDHYYIGHVTGYDLSNNDPNATVSPTNSSGLVAIQDVRYGLVEKCRYNGADTTTWTNTMRYACRSKHSVFEGEWREIEALWYDQGGSAPYNAWAITEGTTDPDATRNVVRGCNFSRDPTGGNNAVLAGGAEGGVHSVMYHANSIKGSISATTTADGGVPNSAQIHIWGNLVENAGHASNYGWGASFDTDWVPATGKSAIFENNLSGALGTLMGAGGVPLNAAHVGQYGHTIYQ